MRIGSSQRATGTSKNLLLIAYALSVMLFALCFSAEAQQPKKIPRIGYLIAVPGSGQSARNEAFRQGLHEFGYVEGKNIVIESRSAGENLIASLCSRRS